MSHRKRVYALITPLQLYFEDHLDEYDFIATRSPLGRVPFSNLQHWAIEVGDWVYEVTRMGVAKGELARYRAVDSKQWWSEPNRMDVDRRLLGYTEEPHTRLDDWGDEIWRIVMHQQYYFATTNCQMFAAIFQGIAINPSLVVNEKYVKIEQLPTPLNPLIHIGEKIKQVKRYAVATEKMAFRWLQSHHDHTAKRTPMLPSRPTEGWCAAIQDEWAKRDFSQPRLWEVVGKANQRRSSIWHKLPRLITSSTGLDQYRGRNRHGSAISFMSSSALSRYGRKAIGYSTASADKSGTSIDSDQRVKEVDEEKPMVAHNADAEVVSVMVHNEVQHSEAVNQNQT